MTSKVAICIEDPRDEGARALVAALDAHLQALYPPESNHFLDIAALGKPDVRFFVARRAGEAIGCGALRIDPAGYGEVKRMFVAAHARRGGLGRRILQCIEAQAARERLALLRLETGIHQHAALALYRSFGYIECAPFGEYRADPLSRFMEKRLPSVR
jgi:putative acetyltransferase